MGLGQTRCDATGGLLSLIPINDLGNIGVEVHLELILRQACLRNSLPKAGDVIRLHLLVLRWRLIQLRQLDEEAVLEQLFRCHADWVLGHDLHADCVLTRDYLSVGSHHIVLDICGFYLQLAKNKLKDH